MPLPPLYFTTCDLAATFQSGMKLIYLISVVFISGIFFQFIMCVAILIVGIIIDAVRGFPRIIPLAMLTGVLWATGNALVVPIVHCSGLGLGLLLWSSVTLLSGWASGRSVNSNIPSI